MDDKVTRAHNRMARETGETKTRTKLSKSKHGWLKIAMGVTFASTSLFLMSSPTFADENTATAANQSIVTAQPEAQTSEQDNTGQTTQTTSNDENTPSNQVSNNVNTTGQIENQTNQLALNQQTQATQLATQSEIQTNANSNISPDHQAFINQVAPGAQSTWDKYGVLPSVSIAQAIVESAWGQSAPGNNLYGIKGDYNGNSTLQTTQEYYNGQYVTIQDQFRAYPDLATSVEDHGKFLAVNPRYANLLYSQDYNYVCQMLQADGYATDPQYANTLISIISYNNLHQFDDTLGKPSNTGNNDTSNNQTTNNEASSSNDSDINTNDQPSTSDNSQITPASGAYTTNEVQNIRDAASLSSNISATLEPGDTIYYDGTTNNDGYTWLHYTSYSGHSRWIANLNDDQSTTQNQTTTNNGDSNMITPASGAYTATQSQSIRNEASTTSEIAATLNPGNTIYYDGTTNNDGYTWLHYISYSGNSHWVANLNNSQSNSTIANNEEDNMTPASGAYTTNGAQNVRDAAGLSSNVSIVLSPGETIYYDGTKQADGYTWLHYTSYSGQSRWIAKLNLAF